MKRLIFLFAAAAAVSIFGAGCSAYTQGANAEGRAALDSLNYIDAMRAIKDREFRIRGRSVGVQARRHGARHVESQFVSLMGDKATVQVAPFDSGGPNGVGGVTVEGRVTNIEEKTDKRGNTRITMNVMGRGVFAAVDITLPRGSNNGMVTINPNLNSNRITLYGKIVPAERSRVFKGMSL